MNTWSVPTNIPVALSLILAAASAAAQPAAKRPPHAPIRTVPVRMTGTVPMGGFTAAEKSYLEVLGASSDAVQAALVRVSQETGGEYDESTTPAKAAEALADLKATALRGERLPPCPTRLRPVQRRYAAAMVEYVNYCDQVTDGIDRKDAEAIGRGTRHQALADGLIDGAKAMLNVTLALSQSGVSASLAGQVRDYNDLLLQARDDSRVADVGMAVQKLDLKAASDAAGTPDWVKADRRMQADLKAVSDAEELACDALRRAMSLRRAIRANRASLHLQETSRCLPYEKIPTKLFGTGASTLRFIERPGGHGFPALADDPEAPGAAPTPAGADHAQTGPSADLKASVMGYNNLLDTIRHARLIQDSDLAATKQLMQQFEQQQAQGKTQPLFAPDGTVLAMPGSPAAMQGPLATGQKMIKQHDKWVEDMETLSRMVLDDLLAYRKIQADPTWSRFYVQGEPLGLPPEYLPPKVLRMGGGTLHYLRPR